MKIFKFFIILLIFTGCQAQNKEPLQDDHTYSFFVGTYTNHESRGIYQYHLQNDGKLKSVGLVAESVNPSFLALSADKKFLLAVNEINEEGSGTVESFLIGKDSLEFLSKRSSGGADPCFVAVNSSNYVLTANYNGGNVGLLKLNRKGELSPLLDLQQHSGHGTTERQDAPHAHSAWFESGNNIISVDLGTNELWFSKLDTIQQKLIPSDPGTLPMQTGAGPRHLTFHPNGKWIYVVNELDCTITLLQKSDTGIFRTDFVISTLPSDFDKPNTCADIHNSADGKFVYASNRGHNSIAIYQVNNENGSLKLVGHQSTQGDGPRNFSLSPDGKYIVVANQRTDNLVSFMRNETTGLLTYVDQVTAPTPVCILFQE